MPGCPKCGRVDHIYDDCTHPDRNQHDAHHHLGASRDRLPQFLTRQDLRRNPSWDSRPERPNTFQRTRELNAQGYYNIFRTVAFQPFDPAIRPPLPPIDTNWNTPAITQVPFGRLIHPSLINQAGAANINPVGVSRRESSGAIPHQSLPSQPTHPFDHLSKADIKKKVEKLERSRNLHEEALVGINRQLATMRRYQEDQHARHQYQVAAQELDRGDFVRKEEDGDDVVKKEVADVTIKKEEDSQSWQISISG
jgi:hypothetical protein